MANVRDFGAAGDGETDDTEALLHALEAGDGVLRLSKGTYRITQPITIDTTKTGYAAVLGEGGTTRIVMAGAGPALRIVGDHRGTASPASYREQTWEKERFPTISGIEIVGAHAEAIGIELRKTTKTTISQVLVRKCKTGIQLVERNRDFVLADSHLLDNDEFGLFFDRCNLHQIIVHGNHISWNRKAGIKSLDGDVHNLQITGNDIEYNNHPGVDESPDGEPRGAEIWFEATEGIISEVTIASNTIQATVQAGGANVRIWGSPKTSPRGARLIAITGNVLGSQTRGIELRDAHRVTVAGNTLYGNDELTLYAKNSSAIAVGANTVSWRSLDTDPPRDGFLFEDCDNCSLTGLVTDRLGYGTTKQGAAVTMRRCTDMAVSGCQITDSLVRGVELVDCRRCRISDNSIVDRREKPRLREAIRILGDSRDNLVQNNLVGGTTETPIDVPQGTATVQGNVVVQ